MRIAVPSTDATGMQSPVCEHFGQTPFFTIVDNETQATVVHKNPGHTDGKTPAQHLAELGVQVVLGGGMGGRAIQLLDQLGIEVFLTATGTVADALAAYSQGTLASGAEAGACTDPCPPGETGHSH